MLMYLTDNVAVDWVKVTVQSYVSTMKQLAHNTFAELYRESWPHSSSAASMTSQDMVVFMTAVSSLLGLMISLAVVYIVCRIVCWICTDQSATGRSEY